MPKKQWTFNLSPAPTSEDQDASGFAPRPQTHTVDLDHNYWTTKRKIYVDGQLLPPDAIQAYGVYGQFTDDVFDLAGHTCHISTRSNGVTYNYDFGVDGRSVQSGHPLLPKPETLRAAPGDKRGTPLWAWLFLGVLLVALLMGQIAAGLLSTALVHTPPSRYFLAIGIGIGGFYKIQSLARDYSTSLTMRVAQCFGVCLLVGLAVFVVDLILGVVLR